MTQDIMLKAFGRAVLLAFLIIIFMAALWHYTVLTLAILVIAWVSLMLQLDPPEYWDR